MKLSVLFAVAFCLVACFMAQSLAVPAPEAEAAVEGLEALNSIEPEPDHGRYKRATCDLLSAAGVSHSACAAHCILLGKRGGYCNSRAVCVCRN
ncbi:hypothetical protein DOY81_009036 [Sarcophaga bullata]|nr:hypothetical protein DOY81_009036 [Sarcophaga bullata]